jgi:hypothetical protein
MPWLEAWFRWALMEVWVVFGEDSIHSRLLSVTSSQDAIIDQMMQWSNDEASWGEVSNIRSLCMDFNLLWSVAL